MNPGTRVRYSGCALQADKDYWLGLGDYTLKNRAKRYWEARVALRGTVLSVKGPAVTVAWDDGSRSESLSYRLMEAKS